MQIAVDVADQPGTPALAQQRDNALVGARGSLWRRLRLSAFGKISGYSPNASKVFVDILANGFDPRLCLDRFDLA